MDLTNDDVLKILSIIDESGYNEIRLEIGDLKLHVQKQSVASASALPVIIESPRPAAVASPVVQAVAAPVAAATATLPAPTTAAKTDSIPDGAVAVNAPILGTFYRATAPGEKPFVDVGSKVGANDTICLIEVMKLFNSVKAGIAGTVVKVVAENGAMVEHGQVLVYIKPDA